MEEDEHEDEDDREVFGKLSDDNAALATPMNNLRVEVIA